MEEEIKDITGFEGIYRISNKGVVYSSKKSNKNGYIKGVADGWGYRQVYLSNKGTCKRDVIHRLVAKHFIPNPENKEEVNHKDGDKGNNNVENLEWVTPSENIRHAFKNGLMTRAKGINHSMCKLTENQVKEIRYRYALGERTCTLQRAYNVSSGTIYGIVRKITWKHLL